MRVAWLCHYPLDLIQNLQINFDQSRHFHPAPWIVNLSNALSKHKEIELHIINETSWVRKDQHFNYNKIHFHILRNPYSVPFFTRGFPGWFPIGVLTNYYLNRKNISNVLSDIKPDLLHSHGTEFQYAYSSINSKIPVIISLQGIISYLKDYLYNWNKYALKKQTELEKTAIRKSKYFISRTKFSDEYIKKINPDAFIFHIDEMVNNKFFSVTKEKPGDYLLYVGSVTPSKGIEDLLTAFRDVKKKYYDLKLIIAGEYKEKYLNQLKNKFSDLFNSKNILFKGYLNVDELLKLYMAAKIFVFPSHFETTPNVLMEAMAIGLPIISTKTGGIPDMIAHEKTGLLTEIKSPGNLAKLIIRILNEPDLAEELGKNARTEALMRFSERDIVKKTIEVYKYITLN